MIKLGRKYYLGELRGELALGLGSVLVNNARFGAFAQESVEDPATEDMPIHQQLFRTQEEPCIMPLPPEDLECETETAEAPEDAAAPETAAEPEGTETKEDPEKAKPESAEKAEEPDADKTEGEENE